LTFGLAQVRKIVRRGLFGHHRDGTFHRGRGKGLSDGLFASSATAASATATTAAAAGV
jgi:hypothetical protein